MRGDESAERHQIARAVVYVQFEHAFRSHPVALLGLHHHALLAAGIGEVVDHLRTESGRQRTADRFKTHPQGARLVTVDHYAQLRRLRQTFHHRIENFRVAVGLTKHLITSSEQRFPTQAGTILQA